MNNCGPATTDRKRPTLRWFEHHSHAVDVIVDQIDDVLVGSLVGCDEAEIVRIWKGDKPLANGAVGILGILEPLEVVAVLDVVDEECEDGVESEEECDGREWVSLKNSSLEREWIGTPSRCYYNRSCIVIDVLDVVFNWIWKVIPA